MNTRSRRGYQVVSAFSASYQKDRDVTGSSIGFSPGTHKMFQRCPNTLFGAVALFFQLPMLSAQQLPPRNLSRPDLVSVDTFGALLNVIEVADGKLLVNEGARKRLVLLDATLGHAVTILDSSVRNGSSYGPTAAPIIQYLPDSVLFVDVSNSVLVLLNLADRTSRAVALPRASDLTFIGRSGAAVDSNGRLVYRGRFVVREPTTASPAPAVLATSPTMAPIVRANFDTRTIDTLASYALQPAPIITRTETANKIIETWLRSALPTIDEWTLLSSGEIAIVGGHDYHVDIVQQNGTLRSGAKLPFDFRKLSDRDKQAIVDSARAAVRAHAAATTPVLPPRAMLGSDVARMTQKRLPHEIIEDFVPIDLMPDYYPPVRAGAIKPDYAGHAWILPTTSAQSLHGELVYDVVGNRGEFLFRVRLPGGRILAGFGQHGVVYLGARTATGWLIERTQLLE